MNLDPATSDKGFLALLAIATLGFVLLLSAFFGSVLWAIVVALLFTPLNDRLLELMPGRRNTAAALSLLAVVATIVIPVLVLGSALVAQAQGFADRIRSGEIDFGAIVARLFAAQPDWLRALLGTERITDWHAAQAWLSANFASGIQSIGARAVNIGQGAFGLLVALGVMLYLTFFLIRDGRGIAGVIERAAPLRDEQRRAVLERFIVVIRATIKGSLIVAIAQGTVGGIVFWAIGMSAPLLWGVAMAFMSLLPAIGTGLIWVPVAVYLLATGSVWQGATLIFCGLFVIGLVDNLLRPILVGRDARMPDYIAFISTLGGLELLGLNGFILGPAIAALFLVCWELFFAPDGSRATT